MVQPLTKPHQTNKKIRAMSLVKYRTNKSINGIMNPFFDDAFLKNFMETPARQRNTVPVNILESEAAYELELQIPGWKKELVSIEIKDQVLRISGKKEEQKENKEESKDRGRYTRKEFFSNSFKRNFSLPDDLDLDQIKAQFENGILSITLPKLARKEPSAARRITIG